MHKKAGYYSCNDGNSMLFVCKRTPLSRGSLRLLIYSIIPIGLLNEAYLASKSCKSKTSFKIVIDAVVLYYHIHFFSSSYFLL